MWPPLPNPGTSRERFEYEKFNSLSLNNYKVITVFLKSISKVADLVMTEFFEQGDKEKTVLKIQPLAFMDRDRRDELPRLQMDWIDGICMPLYKVGYLVAQTYI